jgi:transcriptional regulator with XRE-family HTH domain
MRLQRDCREGSELAAQSNSTTALKWWFAVEMRRLREKRKVTREQAAAVIKGSPQNIGHFEVGRSLPKPLELDRLLEFYGVPERAEFFQELRLRAKRGRDWWIGFSAEVPPSFNLFLGLETSAVQIESWDAHVVPGLFQTQATAEALIRAGRPELDAVDVARLVELRMARQREVLDRENPPLVWRVIAESALRWRVGGAAILRDQLEHLMVLAERPGVELQVLPLEVGVHTGTEGTFTILSAPPELHNYPGCVFVEDRIAGHYYEEPEQLMTYRNDLSRLRVQATKPEDTPAFIRRLIEEL